MMHRFEMSPAGKHTLILTYSPAAIRELAERLDAVERLHGPLPAVMQVPVRGRLINRWVCLFTRISAFFTPTNKGFGLLFRRFGLG